MNTEKHALIAQVIEAMGITDRDEKIKLVKALIAQWSLDYFSEIRREQPAQKPKTPTGFEVIPPSTSYSLSYAKYKGRVIGVVFCLDGRHFIFSHKNAEDVITLQTAKNNLNQGKYDYVGGNPWQIPTIEMFLEVNRNLNKFNCTMEKLANCGAGKIVKKIYLDASMKNYNQVGILRLAMWAPWLD